MELYFLRHGLAGQHGDPKYKDDSLRPLTAQGQEKMHRVSLGMKNLNLTFDLILSSPYLRALQTAEIVAQTYNINSKEIHITKNLLPPTSIKKLLQEISALSPKSENILLVGHEPHLTAMVSELLNCDDPLEIDFKKGALCCLSTSSENAILNWLLTPAQLGLMGNG